MEPSIETRGLGKVYGRGGRARRAVADVSLRVERGEILGLLGPNGAGKSTTLRMLCGLLRSSEGEARIEGRAVAEGAAEVRRCVGLVPEDAGHHEKLSLAEELRYFGALYGVERGEVDARGRELAARLELADRWEERLETFSRGMRRKAHLIRALLHRPSVLLLDEPTAGLDPEVTTQVWSLLRELAADGVTVVFCSHHLEEVERLCDRVVILRGRILAEATAGQLATGSRTELRVAGGARSLEAAVRGVAGVRGVEAQEDRLLVDAGARGDVVVPEVVAAVVAAGGRILAVRPHGSDLRDFYRRIVTEAESPPAATEERVA